MKVRRSKVKVRSQGRGEKVLYRCKKVGVMTKEERWLTTLLVIRTSLNALFASLSSLHSI